MSSYSNFESKNNKHTIKSSRSVHEVAFNPSVKSMGDNESSHLIRNLDKYVELIAYLRWMPDVFLDLIRPSAGGIDLHPDQRTFLRAVVRFHSMYGVYNRGYGKTFNEVIAMFVMSVLFPGVEFSLTAQTKENAAELLRAKHDDIVKKYPWFKNEIYNVKFSKNDAEIVFLNDSKIDVLANSQSSKGQRRNSIMIEESALLDNFTFQDALSPICEHGRMTVGKIGITNPEELHQKISFFSTAGFNGSDEFERSSKMLDGMLKNTGEIVLGADWLLGCWYGRGSTKQQVLRKKKNMSPITFDQNYNSKWTGVSDNAIVDINKFLKLRELQSAEVDNKKGKDEIYLSMDVARSQKGSNNQSSIAVLKVLRNSDDRVKHIQLVNLINLPNGMTFTNQVIQLKRYFKLYNAVKIIYDHNGLGTAIGDEISKEHYDPILGETLPAYNTMNMDIGCDIEDAKKCVYALVAQGNQTDIVVNFMSMVESGKLQLLEKRQDNAFDNIQPEEIRPFIETDFLVDEVANLKIKHMNGGGLSLDRATKSIDKDRFAALAYGLWYIDKFEDKPMKKEVDINKFMQVRKPVLTKY